MAAGPVAGRPRADVQGHPDAVAGVEPGAAHLGQVPARTEVAGPPRGVGLEAAAGQDHGVRGDHLGVPVPGPHLHAGYLAAALGQGDSPGLVAQGDPGPFGAGRQGVDQPEAASHRLDGQAAPEPEPAADLERLAVVGGGEAHRLRPHPLQGGEAAGDERLGQVRVTAGLG